MNANKVTPENLVAAVNFEILTIINRHSASRNAPKVGLLRPASLNNVSY